MKISKQRLTELIKQELKEIIDLPSDLTTPASEAELRMDALSKGWEELITSRILDGETGIWSNTDVVDPINGERRALDEFLAILGNYVVSDEIDEGDAKDLVVGIANQISDNLFEVSPHEWGIAPPKWENMPGSEPQDELQEASRKARDAAARRRRKEREEDPRYQAVKRASEKHIEKAKSEREEKKKKNK